MNPARLVFPALRWNGRGVDQVWPEVRDAIELGVGGLVVFGGSVAAMRELVTRAVDHAGRPLLFAADLERGAAQQFDGATPLPPPAALASLGAGAIDEAARLTATEAASAGIGWVLAPVADLDNEPANPIVGTRGFGADPGAVGDAVRTWIESAQRCGVHACVKHFPGHGRTKVDSHAELPVVDERRDELDADLTPFRSAITANVATVMMAHVNYSAIEPSGAPASMSAACIELLRAELGFEGTVASDAMIMEAIKASGRSAAQAAVDSVRAGCDVLLYPPSPVDAVNALTAALGSGDLDAAKVSEAAERIETLAATARLRVSDPKPASVYDRALELATTTIHTTRGSTPNVQSGERVQVAIIDDDRATEMPAGLVAAEADRGRFASALEKQGVTVVHEAAGNHRLIVAVFCEVRGWKGRSGLAPESERELDRILEATTDAPVVLFGHPRLADQLPAAGSMICAWNGDPLMQEAAARFITSGSVR